MATGSSERDGIKDQEVRRCQGSPDRQKSRERRRNNACTYSDIPEQVRRNYSEGQAPVLVVIAREVQTKSYCDDYVDVLAAKAGVCRTMVQNTKRRAKELGHIWTRERPDEIKGRKHKTTIITITSGEWLACLKRAPSGTWVGYKTCSPRKILSSTKNIGGAAARDLAFEISKLCGLDETDAPSIVQRWLSEYGWEPTNIVRVVRDEAKKERERNWPPRTARYFEPPLRRLYKYLEKNAEIVANQGAVERPHGIRLESGG